MAVFLHHQGGVEQPHTFAEVAWLVPLLETPKHVNIYCNYPKLEVNFWEYGNTLCDEYQGDKDLGHNRNEQGWTVIIVRNKALYQ
ncbi:hypothetical protein DACRYDRAFT_108815 [Dacryopinax primogenitus]|uniref:Uncharacterized protein n=1 Tax=Dacryopinax primogenitus (strain DJM 731) TaxID=1858805 RepID=M5FT53_DACPD|nr:uncharacterized protein DACRYDRAFT_108815 [Dacryopinax primogenitus]EJU00756.1 hypothetical protein DACRYDRAFT_108815 [Dacryopinax primogenitus]